MQGIMVHTRFKTAFKIKLHSDFKRFILSRFIQNMEKKGIQKQNHMIPTKEGCFRYQAIKNYIIKDSRSFYTKKHTIFDLAVDFGQLLTFW